MLWNKDVQTNINPTASDEIKQKITLNKTFSHVQTVTRGNKIIKEIHVIQAAEPLHRDNVPLVCWDAVEALAELADEVELLVTVVDSARTLEMYARTDALLRAGGGVDEEDDCTTLGDGKLPEEVVELELELEDKDEDEEEEP
jgi:HEAT repeat protein